MTLGVEQTPALIDTVHVRGIESAYPRMVARRLK